MTNETNNALPKSTNQSDPLLQYIIHLVETVKPENVAPDTPIETGITLFVGGLLISGVVIKRNEYFKTFWGGVFSTILNEDDKEESSSEEADQDNFIHYQFIHLRDAEIFDPAGHRVPGEGPGVLLRLRTSAVDGFMKEMLGLEPRKAVRS